MPGRARPAAPRRLLDSAARPDGPARARPDQARGDSAGRPDRVRVSERFLAYGCVGLAGTQASRLEGMVKTKAAVLMQQPGEWEVTEVELDGPGDHEVLVRLVASGLCHSDDHIAKADGIIGHFPYCGGHEGAGVVEEVGPGVHSLKPGDHIVTSFIPGCGRCAFCASGQQNLCQYGSLIMAGSQLDGTYRMHYQGRDVARSSLVGTFAEYSVMPEWSAIRIPEHVSLRTAALLGCGVPTGWGSAVNAAEVRPGASGHRDGHRRDRHQRRAGGRARRGGPRHRRRPGAVQARDRAEAGRHRGLRLDRRGGRRSRARSPTGRAPTRPSSPSAC